MTTLPRLELANPDNLSSYRADGEICQFDEAVITIAGREEDTIVVACEGALDLADRLIRYINAHGEIERTLTAALHALRHYERGDAAPGLARDIANDLETLIKQTGEAA